MQQPRPLYTDATPLQAGQLSHAVQVRCVKRQNEFAGSRDVPESVDNLRGLQSTWSDKDRVTLSLAWVTMTWNDTDIE